MVIDFHTHIFPDKIAAKAAANIGKFYDLPMLYDGAVSTLVDLYKNTIHQFLKLL